MASKQSKGGSERAKKLTSEERREIAIRAARPINPKIHVITRADFLRQTTSLQKAGADEVFSGEGEVALAMTDSILRRLGTTPEHLDEERARIRMELFEEHP